MERSRAALAKIVLVLVPLAVAVEEDGRRGGGSNVHQLRADFSFSNLTQLNITSAPPPPFSTTSPQRPLPVSSLAYAPLGKCTLHRNRLAILPQPLAAKWVASFYVAQMYQ